MATTVTEIINRIRINISDNDQEIGFTDDNLLGWLNSASRFVRREIARIKPTLIASKATGTLSAGLETITLPYAPMKIIDVRVDNKKLDTTTIDAIDDMTDTGRPEAYYLLGLTGLQLHPIADGAYAYSALYVPEYEPLTLVSTLPLPSDYDDVLTEYVSIRAQYRNEFDMSQEMQLMATLVDQIQTMVRGVERKAKFVSGYYGGANG